MAQRIAKRVMLIGWDAADWEFIEPLMDKGMMPNLKKLVSGGVMGKIATLAPMLSPMLWNSIATGKLGHKHGILGFLEPDGKGNGRPVSSTSRQAKALWNILSQSGMRSCVVNWFASHPAEKINGVVFSDRYEMTIGDKAEMFPLDPAAIHPPEMLETAKQLQVRPTDLHEQQVLPFIPEPDLIDQDKDERIALAARLVAEATTIHNAATYLAEHEQWDLLAVYYDTIDHAGHAFMEYHPPKMDHVTDTDFRAFRHVMTSMYGYHDLMLGRLMELAGPDTHILLLSDHGFQSGALRPKIFPHPHDPEKQIGPGVDPLAWHRRHGVFVLNGPGVKSDDLVHGTTLLDVCPTILTLLGLPVGRDMDGVTLTQVFKEPVTVEQIDTWEGEAPNDGVHRGEFADDPYAAQLAMQQLADLGYIEKPGEDTAAWLSRMATERKSVLAQILFSSRDFAGAEKLLREVVQETPTPGIACRLIMTLLEQQKLGEAEDMVERYEVLKEDMPLMMLMKGQLACMRGQHDAAFELFQRVLASDPRSTQVYVYLGQIHLHRRQYPLAEAAFRKVLEQDPDHPEAHDGLGVSLSGQGQLEDALFHHMQSAALFHHRWMTHYNMGLILLEMGRTDWGIRALETTIELNPDLPAPHRVLARVFRRRKNDADSAMKHLRQLAEKRARFNARKKQASAWNDPTASPALSRFDDTSVTATTRFDERQAPGKAS